MTSVAQLEHAQSLVLSSSPTKTYDVIKRTSAGMKLSRTYDFEWHRCFKDGGITLENGKRRDRKASLDAALEEMIKDVFLSDMCVIVYNVNNIACYNNGTVHRVSIREHLNIK